MSSMAGSEGSPALQALSIEAWQRAAFNKHAMALVHGHIIGEMPVQGYKAGTHETIVRYELALTLAISECEQIVRRLTRREISQIYGGYVGGYQDVN
jgi:hypothetical protein